MRCWLATPTIAKRCGCSSTRLRSTYRRRTACLGDGSRHPHRTACWPKMRASDWPVRVSGGNAEGSASLVWKKQLLDKPWQQAREGVAVKLLANDGELYVFAQSDDRVAKERAMRRRQLKWLAWKRLRELIKHGSLPRRDADEARCRTGQSTHRMAPGRYRDGRGKPHVHLRTVTVRSCDVLAAAKGVICCAPISPRTIPHCCGKYYYPARCRGTGIQKPRSRIWRYAPYSIKTSTESKPTFSSHSLAYCLQVTLQRRLHALAPGADRAQRSGEIRGGPDDRCPPAGGKPTGGGCC